MLVLTVWAVLTAHFRTCSLSCLNHTSRNVGLIPLTTAALLKYAIFTYSRSAQPHHFLLQNSLVLYCHQIFRYTVFKFEVLAKIYITLRLEKISKLTAAVITCKQLQLLKIIFGKIYLLLTFGENVWSILFQTSRVFCQSSLSWYTLKQLFTSVLVNNC